MFSKEEGKVVIILSEGKVPTLGEPGLYTLEVDFKNNGAGICKRIELVKAFYKDFHFRIHHLCKPIFDYLPIGEPYPFVFGRYLSALRRSNDEQSARLNALWFLASVLAKEGFIVEDKTITEFIKTRKLASIHPVWKKVKRGLVNIEGKG
ncbi:hypothetical protein TST_0314 [Thermosulfidibacter takaii ABI70S6]|uniref:Uncharacterized protein n=2 Tax=Thermosulfidibacter takaii TaxID=412593 RepID=A0A0S3QS15_THET7|nr:hypothetical protein TST_0314 [Thermosulfidibacter takaii ABI70S6]